MVSGAAFILVECLCLGISRTVTQPRFPVVFVSVRELHARLAAPVVSSYLLLPLERCVNSIFAEYFRIVQSTNLSFIQL